MKRRKARYLATDNGRRKTREKSRRYYKRHKEDPAFKENRHHINVMRWAKVKKDRLMGYYVLWTMDGVIKIRLV